MGSESMAGATLKTCIDELLAESATNPDFERRSSDRKPIVRPITIRSGRDRDRVTIAYSRDVSQAGLGIVSRENWQPRTIADLEIHLISNQEARVRAEVRWSKPFGDGWFLTGWKLMRDL